MTKYWIMAGDIDNWKMAVESQFWAVGRRIMKNVRKGDKIVAYLSHGVSAVYGVFRATSDPYYDNTSPIFGLGPRKYPYRVHIMCELLLEKPVDIRPLIDKLSFIKNPVIWGAYFQQSPREISKEDFKKILYYIKTEGRSKNR